MEAAVGNAASRSSVQVEGSGHVAAAALPRMWSADSSLSRKGSNGPMFMCPSVAWPHDMYAFIPPSTKAFTAASEILLIKPVPVEEPSISPRIVSSGRPCNHSR